MFKCFSKAMSVIIVFSLLISGCAEKNPFENDDLIVQAEKNNTLNLGMDSVDTLNPVLSKSISVHECMQLIFEPLFTFDEAHNPIGVLAEGCVQSDDGYSYTIKIKQGVLWHDNTELTSQDILHTFNLIRDSDTIFTSSLSAVSSVYANDNYSLTVRLSRPVPNFSALLYFPIVKRTATADVIDYIPIGTGPYKYSEKISSGKIKLVPNPSWQGNLATIDEVYLNEVKDKQSLINAFNANTVNVMTSGVMDLRSNTPRGNNNILDYTSNNLVFLGINNSKSEYSQNNTRQALSYLIDRDDIVTTEVFSRAVPVKIPINPSSWYFPKNGDNENDAEYIKELLLLDGWRIDSLGKYAREVQNDENVVSQQLTADIIVNDNNDERLKIAKKIASKFTDFGVDTTVTVLSFEEYQTRIAEKNYQMFIGEIKIPYNMDLYNLLSDNNYFGYSSQEMMTILNKVGTSKTTEEIKSAFSDFSVQFLSDVPFVPLFFRKESVIFEKTISGTSMPTMFTAFREPENWYTTRAKSAESVTEENKEVE